MTKSEFKHNRFLEFIGIFLLPYHWAYKKGIVEGKRRSGYFKAYTEGQIQANNFIMENFYIKLKNKRKSSKI